MRRSVIGGKVMRSPDLERLDAARGAPLGATVPVTYVADDTDRQFKAGLYSNEADWLDAKAAARKRAIEMGIDGSVPLAQARVNAGLDPGGSGGMVAANDNHNIAVAA